MNFNEFQCVRKKYLKMKEKFNCEVSPQITALSNTIHEWLLKEYPFGDNYNNYWYLHFNFRLDHDLILHVSHTAYNAGYVEEFNVIKAKIEKLANELPCVERVVFE